MGWICQLVYSFDPDNTEFQLQILRKMEMKVQQFIKNGIRPVMVFDGLRLGSKDQTKSQRDLKIENYSNKYLSCLSVDNESIFESSDETKEDFYKVHSQKVTKDFTYLFVDLCRDKGFEYLVSPYESDSQLLYMHQKGYIDYIYSEDSDFVARGCDHIVKGLQQDDTVQILNPGIIKAFLQKDCKGVIEQLQYFFTLSKRDRLLVSLMCGSDYLDNIKGIGFLVALGFFDDDYNEIQKLEAFLQKKIKRGHKIQKILPNGVSNIAQYMKKLEEIEVGLDNQLVMDPMTK